MAEYVQAAKHQVAYCNQICMFNTSKPFQKYRLRLRQPREWLSFCNACLPPQVMSFVSLDKVSTISTTVCWIPPLLTHSANFLHQARVPIQPVDALQVHSATTQLHDCLMLVLKMYESASILPRKIPNQKASREQTSPQDQILYLPPISSCDIYRQKALLIRIRSQNWLQSL